MGFQISCPKYSGRDYSKINILERKDKTKFLGPLEFWTKSLITSDWQSAIAVACVSLPLSVALAIASGATPNMGLAAGMYGPMIQGVLGGSEYNILGPAGALVNILQGLAVKHSVYILPYVAILAGMITLVCSFINVGNMCMVIRHEPAVLEGFSAAVAVTIGLGQLNSVFGIEGLKRQAWFHGNFGNSMRAIFTNSPGITKSCVWETDDRHPELGLQKRCESGFQWAEFLAFLVCFTALCEFAQNKGPGLVLGTRVGERWNNFGKNRKPWLLFLALFGIVIGAIFEATANKNADRVHGSYFPLLLKHKYATMSDTPPAKILHDADYRNFGFNWTMKSTATTLSIPYILIGALEVAFVAILETIVSAILGQQKKCRFTGRTEEGEEPEQESFELQMEDKKEEGNVESDQANKSTTDGEASPTETSPTEKEEPLPPIPAFEPTNEMFGLAWANIISGFSGGLPCTGVLLRTEINAESGAESKSSQWANAVIVAIVSVGLLKYFAFLPFFCIAAMLVRSAIGLSLGAQRCWKEELMPAYKAVDASDKDKFLATFDIVNFVVVFLICLMLDGAVGLMVGFVGKYFAYKYSNSKYPKTQSAKKLDDLTTDSDLNVVQ